MNCPEVIEALREGMAPNIALRAHISTCPKCSEEEAFWREVRLEMLRPPAPQPFLHSRIMATVKAEARAREERQPWFAAPWTRRWVLPTLTAALVVVGEGYGVSMALFRQVPDDMVVRFSEDEAMLLAHNALPGPGHSPSDPLDALAAPADLEADAGRAREEIPHGVKGQAAGPGLRDAPGDAPAGAPSKPAQKPFELAQMEERSAPAATVPAPAPEGPAAPPSRAGDSGYAPEPPSSYRAAPAAAPSEESSPASPSPRKEFAADGALAKSEAPSPGTLVPPVGRTDEKKKDAKGEGGRMGERSNEALSSRQAPAAGELTPLAQRDEAEDKRTGDKKAQAGAAGMGGADSRRAPAAVRCQISGPEGLSAQLDLPEGAAPPPGSRWTVRVAGGGKLFPPRQGDGPSAGQSEAIARAISRLQLPEGEYKISRKG